MMDQLLNVEDLVVKKGNEIIIDDVSFFINYHEIVGLIGKNGAGKTTLLKALSGLQECRGFVSLNNQRVRFPNSYKNISYIGDQANFYPFWNALENLYFFSGFKQKKDEIKNILNVFGMGDVTTKKLSDFSLGMRQYLNVIRGLMNNPKLILMDESFNGLDPLVLKNLKREMKKITNTSNTAIIVSSHSLKELNFLCNRFIFIHNRKIVANIANTNDFTRFNAYIKYDKNPNEIINSLNLKDYYVIKLIKKIYIPFASSIKNATLLDNGITVLEDIYFSINGGNI